MGGQSCPRDEIPQGFPLAMSDKSELFQTIIRELETHINQLRAAAGEAHSAATDPDSKAESKYDTRSLEASYLAEGQAQQLTALQSEMDLLKRFETRDYDLNEPISLGALVETDLDDYTEWFILLPSAGGRTIVWEDREITTLSPSSKLYQLLSGQSLGDIIEDTGHMITEIM